MSCLTLKGLPIYQHSLKFVLTKLPRNYHLLSLNSTIKASWSQNEFLMTMSFCSHPHSRTRTVNNLTINPSSSKNIISNYIPFYQIFFFNFISIHLSKNKNFTKRNCNAFSLMKPTSDSNKKFKHPLFKLKLTLNRYINCYENC